MRAFKRNLIRMAVGNDKMGIIWTGGRLNGFDIKSHRHTKQLRFRDKFNLIKANETRNSVANKCRKQLIKRARIEDARRAKEEK